METRRRSHLAKFCLYGKTKCSLFQSSCCGSLGKIEKLDGAQFRCYVEGQHDERGRNRQANWYYFRMDGVKGREITLTLTDFVGKERKVPVLLMEQRIGTSQKLGRRPTLEDRLTFGKKLITVMAETVLE